MLLTIYTRNAAGVFQSHYAFFEQTLSATGKNDGLPLSVRQRGVCLDLNQLVLFPLYKPHP